jgi:hypothetical protein
VVHELVHLLEPSHSKRFYLTYGPISSRLARAQIVADREMAPQINVTPLTENTYSRRYALTIWLNVGSRFAGVAHLDSTARAQ